MKKEKKKDDIA